MGPMAQFSPLAGPCRRRAPLSSRRPAARTSLLLLPFQTLAGGSRRCVILRRVQGQERALGGGTAAAAGALRLGCPRQIRSIGGVFNSTRSTDTGSEMAMQAARRLASWSLQRRLLLPSQVQAPSIPNAAAAAAFLHSHATSFGYKQVREEDKSKLVGNVFSSVASSYDLMNDLMSVGLHRLWKDRLISKLNPFPGMKHLDVAGGTGDVAFRVLERIKSVGHRAMQGTLTETEEDTHIYVCDINPNMLNVGKKRAAERGYSKEHCLSWVQGDAEALSFEDGSMDGYTIAFGIRNVTHIEKALSEAYRVLKRGGRFLCLELSHVDVPVFKEMKSLLR
ncbi:2-methoxy-6-polyprenyl-1,4-benzoquinol methylase, mitochondrial isoform X2 [Miscanthus floridulus]|uniref:2-methoxy-6-polyprenyl-1,4-benzoquinol methylase, mitochondrial isoform X2 n=1 Tax=Miscanthus floridulus TaxID=154761 RepID=UPI00345947FC